MTALIGEVAADAGPQLLVGLTDIDRLAVIIEECVHTPAVVTDQRPSTTGVVLKRRVQEFS